MGIWDSLMSDVSASGAMQGLGTLGDITFRVSAYNDIYTFDDFSLNASSRTAQHDIIGEKALTEYLGPGLQEVSMKIKLCAQWGVNPVNEAEKLIDYCESGTILTFTAGGRKVGKNKWLITSVGETVKYYDNAGNILSAELAISMKEYVPPKAMGGASA